MLSGAVLLSSGGFLLYSEVLPLGSGVVVVSGAILHSRGVVLLRLSGGFLLGSEVLLLDSGVVVLSGAVLLSSGGFLLGS